MLPVETKSQITVLRMEGYGYKAIANRLKITRDGVRDFCRYNGLKKAQNKHKTELRTCLHCGETFSVAVGKRGRPQKYCFWGCKELFRRANRNKKKP